ncbi:MAG: hypothetical protein J6X16_09350 [Bacteroidales bacterium]|nr:hypothetical protein [Bacteroidales bacterium]
MGWCDFGEGIDLLHDAEMSHIRDMRMWHLRHHLSRGSGEMSHISDMQRRYYLPVTTLRYACASTTLRNSVARVVLIVPVGTSHAFGMT